MSSRSVREEGVTVEREPTRWDWKRYSLVGLAVACLFASHADTPAADAAVTKGLSCGDTVKTSVKLTHDLTNCRIDGLVVGARGITIDLNGHTISGTSGDGSYIPNACQCAINDTAGFDDVEVRGGRVEDFIDGVRFSHARGIAIRGLDSRGNWDNAAALDHVSDSLVADSSFATTYRGVLTEASHGIEIRGDKIHDIEHSGVALITTTDSTVRGSTFTDMGDYGPEVLNSSRNVVTHNRIRRANSDGIAVASTANQFDHLPSLGNAVVDNDVRSGSTGIELIEIDGATVRDTLVSRNTVLDTSDNGILLDGVTTDGSGYPPYTYVFGPGPDKSRIVENTTNGNAVDGIHLDTPGNSIARNVADRNTGFGISAFPGNMDGGGNRARGNGEREQCRGVRCS